MNELTQQDIEALRQPLPLEAGHEVRLAESKKKSDGSYFARWLVYTTEEPVCERLSSVDLGWSLRWVDTTLTTTTATVTQELTIKTATRTGSGSSELTRGNKPNPHAVKAAATDSLKRGARLFGVGGYLLNAPQIMTDWAQSPTWRQKADWEKEAFNKFAAWYRQQFGGNAPRRAQPAPAASAPPPSKADVSAEPPPSKLDEHFGPRDNALQGDGTLFTGAMMLSLKRELTSTGVAKHEEHAQDIIFEAMREAHQCDTFTDIFKYTVVDVRAAVNVNRANQPDADAQA